MVITSGNANQLTRLNASYALAEQWKLNARIGSYTKIAPYTVLGYRDNNNNLANKDVPYTRCNHYVTGLEYLPSKTLRLTVEGFYKQYSDYLMSDLSGISLANLGGNGGIETGHTTFRDGMFGPSFLSFERFLNIPPAQLVYLTPEMRGKIEAYLDKTSTYNPAKPAEIGPKLLSPREKMDLAESLLQDPNSTKGAEILGSLLEYEAESDYWRNYVFNRCCRLRKNPKVQNFIASCLQGDDEIWFKKASDVIGFCGLPLGEKVLAAKGLLFALNWEDATANDPKFRAALEKTLKIIFSPPS